MSGKVLMDPHDNFKGMNQGMFASQNGLPCSKDFVGWEEKEDFVKFSLVAIEENAVHFSGISFYRIDDDHLIGYIVMRTKDGIREEKLTFQRTGTSK